MREDLLAQAEQELQLRRLENERTEERRRRKIQEEEPDIYALVRERENLIFDSMRGILQKKAAPGDLTERMEQISVKIREALRKRGYAEDYLSPVYSCPVCRDQGYTGEPVREMCLCLKRMYREKLRKEIGLGNSRAETFENYDETLFPVEKIPGMPFSQRELNRVIRNKCEQWANDWPDQRPRDLLIYGKSGLGKTWFLRAMTDRLIQRDVQTLLVTAFEFLDKARRGYYEEDGGLDEMIRVPVLMIDDLGSEPLMKNTTLEMLFHLIEERQRRNLATVCSSNLTVQELRERYNERIVSRLTDTRNSETLQLMGRDVRTGRK